MSRGCTCHKQRHYPGVMCAFCCSTDYNTDCEVLYPCFICVVNHTPHHILLSPHLPPLPPTPFSSPHLKHSPILLHLNGQLLQILEYRFKITRLRMEHIRCNLKSAHSSKALLIDRVNRACAIAGSAFALRPRLLLQFPRLAQAGYKIGAIGNDLPNKLL